MTERVYTSPSPYLLHQLVHHYDPITLQPIAREWRVKDRFSRPLNHPLVALDGSPSLEQLMDDIHQSFLFTSDFPSNDLALYRTIYETKLPPNTILRYGPSRGMDKNILSLVKAENHTSHPVTYYDLFSQIGLKSDGWRTRTVGPYTVWQYPDGTMIDLEVVNGELLFNYYH